MKIKTRIIADGKVHQSPYGLTIGGQVLNEEVLQALNRELDKHLRKTVELRLEVFDD